jgi:uncharacterized protein YbjT (DUF2867 family)
MKIVVIGGTGLIGSKTVARLRRAGHEVVAAAPSTGVDTVTGEGLEAAMDRAEVVIDLANSRSFEPSDVMEFFTAHEEHLISAESRAGVRHHVVLSIVGCDRSPDNGYFRAKVAQEELVARSGVPYTNVRSTQFMEFLGTIADAGEVDGVIHIATGMFQPIAADDVAAFVAGASLAVPRNGVIEIAGPERAAFDELVRSYLEMMGDGRPVVGDPEALYFGGKVERLSLVPTGEALLGRVTLADWIGEKRAAELAARRPEEGQHPASER